MIATSEQKTAEQAENDFALWAKLVYGKLIVNIVVYADESGTHDLSSNQPGSHVANLAGYFGFTDDWVKFCGDWQTALNKYKVPYFHFREFNTKALCRKPSSHYFNWDDKRRHDFLFELAAIAGNRVRFPFAVSFHLADYHTSSGTKRILAQNFGLTDVQINGPYLVYATLFYDFFQTFLNELSVIKPDFNDSISFVFDQKTKDFYWNVAANQMYGLCKEDDPRLNGISFNDKKKSLPLQAADMIAYRFHQIWENQFKTKKNHIFTPLDHALWGGYSYDEFMERQRKLLNDYAKRPKKT